ncbi:hypothetical protein [Methylocella sp.]|uniref:hypothetical protein n=1 Tax=Methylocella sp. TaxID=1978226 RepID=UPI003784D6EC
MKLSIPAAAALLASTLCASAAPLATPARLVSGDLVVPVALYQTRSGETLTPDAYRHSGVLEEERLVTGRSVAVSRSPHDGFFTDDHRRCEDSRGC